METFWFLSFIIMLATLSTILLSLREASLVSRIDWIPTIFVSVVLSVLFGLLWWIVLPMVFAIILAETVFGGGLWRLK